MTTKMKGLLKGLRYISQIFENEKEEEMEIGLPTDVKHVAHIGWDGPSVSTPSWMNEFKSSPGPASSSAPLNSEDSRARVSSKSCESSPARDLPKLPKSSRRHSSSPAVDSPTKSKSGKSAKNSTRRSSKNSQSNGTSSKQPPLSDGQGNESPRGTKIPAIPKKSRRKKSKESISGGEGSSRSSTRSQPQQPSSSDSYDNSRFSDPSYNQGSPF